MLNARPVIVMCLRHRKDNVMLSDLESIAKGEQRTAVRASCIRHGTFHCRNNCYIPVRMVRKPVERLTVSQRSYHHL